MANRKTPETPTTQAETRQPTFDLNDPVFKEILAQAVAAAMAAKEAEKPAKDAAKMDATIIRAFERKGYKNVVLFDRNKLLVEQPDCTVLTYKKWVELGRKVKKGEKAISVKQFSLFHKDQTAIMTAAERKEYFKKAQAKAAPGEAHPQ